MPTDTVVLIGVPAIARNPNLNGDICPGNAVCVPKYKANSIVNKIWIL
jgi:hypothetical protein